MNEMNNWFDEEASNEAQEVYGSFALKQGEQVVTLEEVYLLPSTTSMAVALVVKFKYDDGSFGSDKFWYINKETGTQRKPDGKPTFGSLQIKQFFGALKINPASMTPILADIQISKEKTLNTKVFKQLFGKKIRIVVRVIEELHYSTNDVVETTAILGWYNVETRQNSVEIREEEPANDINAKIRRSATVKKLKETKATSSVEEDMSVPF